MIPPCEVVQLMICTKDGLERILFPVVPFAFLDKVKGDIRVNEWKQANELTVYVVSAFRCPFCNKIFIVSEMDQLRHEECPKTSKYYLELRQKNEQSRQTQNQSYYRLLD